MKDRIRCDVPNRDEAAGSDRYQCDNRHAGKYDVPGLDCGQRREHPNCEPKRSTNGDHGASGKRYPCGVCKIGCDEYTHLAT